MIAIYKKELKAYFTNMTGVIFVAFLLLIVGFFSTFTNFKGGYPYFETALNSANLMLLFIVPILTMRSLAEERHQKTDQLLYSLPLSIPQIIVGKYLAMLTVFLIPVCILCVYPLILSLYGNVHFLSAYSGIVGFFLLGAALLSVGFFMSSITESQIIAAILTFITLLAFYLMGGLSTLISMSAFSSYLSFAIVILIFVALLYFMTKSYYAAGMAGLVGEGALLGIYLIKPTLLEGTFPAILNWMSVFDRFTSFADGVFDIRAIVYYLTLVFLFLFFSIQSIEKKRWS